MLELFKIGLKGLMKDPASPPPSAAGEEGGGLNEMDGELLTESDRPNPFQPSSPRRMKGRVQLKSEKK